jgi:hypothetical protein
MFLTLGLLAAAGGCDDPFVEQRWRHQQGQLRFTTETVIEREESSPERLERVFGIIGESVTKHRLNTQRNMTGLEEWIRDDMNRWKHAEAGIVAEFQRQMAGDPANARRTLPMLIF